jgi:hypothetical protein
MSKPSGQKLESVQVYENLVIPSISTNVNKTLVAGKNTVAGIADVALELQDSMVIATFTPSRGKKIITVGIPVSFVRTLVFAQ